MNSTRRSRLVVLAPLVLLACKPPSNPTPPVAEKQDSHPELDQYDPPPMEVHFVRATDMQRAIIDGDLAAAQTNAKWIVDNTVVEQLPVRWRPNVPPVINSAQAVVDATTLTAAAEATAQMAAACGACHQKMGMPLVFEAEDSPPPHGDQESHMQRHQWGADRLWEGLVGPSDESWRRGAKALLEAPLLRDAARKKGDADTQQIADHVHALGSSAVSVSEPAQRAGLYGELLGTCATCHAS